MARFGRRLSSQILLYQLLILSATMIVGFLLALSAAQQRLDDEYEQRALGVARSVAATPEIAQAIAAQDRSGVVQRRAEAIRRATRTAFVVVADVDGIRYSHTNPARIGERVSTDPSEALAGRTVLAVETGTLGRSARAKVPLRAADGRIIGQVSVGVLESSIREKLTSIAPGIALYVGIVLTVGLVASLLLARRLKRQTYGLELREIADLLQEREAMLHGVREGVVAVDPEDRIRVVNDEARRLLDLPPDAIGRTGTDVAGPGRLADLLEGRLDGRDLLVVRGDRVLVANRNAVRRDGRDLGAVLTVRDRTELESLVRELDSVRSLTDAMRAQAHEFSNRMHTVSGLLELGHHEEAIGFVKEITHADAEFRTALGTRVRDPVIAALLLAKAAVASERGVSLRLTEDTRLGDELVDARAPLTVLGNLIDNAIDAARAGTADPPWVEVSLQVSDDGFLDVCVADSGPGVPPEARERIFESGYSTKPARGIGTRGMGLSLVRRLAERRGGAVRVEDGPGGGAMFCVRLPVRPASAIAPGVHP